MESRSKSWTDDLPVCHSTGSGYSTNQIYKEDGIRQEGHTFNDRSFHCRVDENTSIYAIFSGQGGSEVAEIAMQRIAAEILLGQLSGRSSEEDIKDALRQAFMSAENEYMGSIDNKLAQKTMLQCELEGISQYEISCQYKDILKKLNNINDDLSVGACVVLALIRDSKLYVCNVGNCRALLCKNDANNVLRVVQLSVDHDLHNEDESLRLCQLGLDVQSFKQSPFSHATRCIGNYIGKAGYKDCAFLSSATSEPIISQPEVVGAIPIDNSFRFLLLISGGLCKALHDVYSSDVNQVNKEIVQMTVEQFRVESTLIGVSQSTVHKVVQMHHDAFMRQIEEQNYSSFKNRDDITLLVRNFNYPMPNATQRRNVPQVSFNPLTQQHSNVSFYDSNSTTISTSDSQYTDTNTSSSYTDNIGNGNMFDKNRKITPYVDFSDYYRNIAIAKAAGTLPPNMNFE